jgi:hypothetical protein
MRHSDFEKVRNEFITYYKSDSKGNSEYYKWLTDMHLDEKLSYGQTHESFTWAKDMIEQVKEDADAKYYKVLLGFPTRSMNGNIYKERNLIAAALAIKGKSPDMNHKSQFWFSPENKYNRWGTVTTEAAKYEDGAVEVLMKVPKTTLCPVCGYGEPLYKLIDKKKIVNVSLNGEAVGPEHEGFRFNEDIPYTLLTNNVLPGFPMARIFPIEAYLPFTSSKSESLTYKNRTIKIIGLKKNMTETTDECPKGYHKEDGKCVKDTETEKKETITGLPNRTGTKNVIASIPSFTSVGGGSQLPGATDNDTPRTNAIASHQNDFPLGGAVKEDVNPFNAVDSTKVYIPPSQDLMNKHATKPPLAGTSSVGGLITMPDNSGAATIQGESIPQLKVQLLQAGQKLKELSEAKIFYEAKLEETYGTINTQIGTIQALETQVERLETKISTINNEKVAFASETKTFSRNLEDMTESRDSYRKQYESIKTAKEDLETKYREQLKTNLLLEEKLTKTSEEYLEQAKKTEQLEDKVKHVNRITKFAAKF